ncbi:unnamed protein product, partial [Musa acuminata subsp. burmannicoides]
ASLKAASHPDDLGGSDDRIGSSDGRPGGGLVIVAAVVAVGVAVLPTEQLPAAAPEPREPHPLPARQAAVHLPRRRRRRRSQSRRGGPLLFRSISWVRPPDRRGGSAGAGPGKGGGRSGGGGLEACLAHVVSGGVAREPAVVDAEGEAFVGMQLHLLLLSLSHRFLSPRLLLLLLDLGR